MTINEAQDEVIEQFQDFTDWMDKYQLLIDLGGDLEPLDDKYKNEQNLIDGCQSRVWVQCDMTDDGRLVFTADSDALIVKGIIALLIQVISGHTPREILDADLYFIEISSYPEGYKENAGIFCHNNPWVIIGETVAGRGNDAWNHYTKILPSYVEEKYQTLHKVEPYVNCQMVAGKDAAKPGEGKNSWLTGTAAWMWYTISEFILGIKPDYEGLNIDPCLPSTAHEYEVIRKFRGGEYHIVVKNPEGREKGVKQITVDGKVIDGTISPCLEGKHEVSVQM